MGISFAITAYNEHEELQVLLNQLEQIAKSNLNAKTQWNKANNFIGGINVNPPNIDYQSEMPGGPISQDQVNTEDIDLSKFE